MSKHCILINGTMGVGKTTVCKELMKLLPASVFLDGDWCWYSHPFTVTEQTKQVVMENIGFMLQNFLKCPDYQNVIFCWVMDQSSILDEVISRIEPALGDTSLFCITLTASPQAIQEHLQKDIDAQLREEDIIEHSLARLALYDKLATYKLDISNLTPNQAAKAIIQFIASKSQKTQ